MFTEATFRETLLPSTSNVSDNVARVYGLTKLFPGIFSRSVFMALTNVYDELIFVKSSIIDV